MKATERRHHCWPLSGRKNVLHQEALKSSKLQKIPIVRSLACVWLLCVTSVASLLVALVQAQQNATTDYLATGRQITGILDRFMSLGYDKRVRPNYGGPPVEVNVTMRILSISSVSEVMMDFTADFYFRQTWHDPRLSFKKLGDIQTLYVGAEVSKKIWLPDTFFGNEKMAYFHEATTPNVFLRIDHSGEVYRSIRLTVTSSCPMNLQYFPMDRQRCTIEAESYGYNIKDIIYRWARKDTAVERDKEISLPQFDIVHTVQKYRLEELSSGTYSRLIAEIHFARRMGYYLIQIYIPSSLIVVISWVSFWLHRNASPARVQLGVTTVLTMTTLMSSTNAALPKISYVKSIDIFLGTCFVMVFAALLEYATVGYLGKRIAMRKAQAQHAQSQIQARLLALLQAQAAQEPGGVGRTTTSSALAAAAAAAIAAGPQPHASAPGAGLFGAPDLPLGFGGAPGNQLGGHTAGAQSSPLPVTGAGQHHHHQTAGLLAAVAAAAAAAQRQHNQLQLQTNDTSEAPEAPERSHCVQCHNNPSIVQHNKQQQQEQQRHLCGHRHRHHCGAQRAHHSICEPAMPARCQNAPQYANCACNQQHAKSAAASTQARQTLPRNITFESDHQQQQQQQQCNVTVPRFGDDNHCCHQLAAAPQLDASNKAAGPSQAAAAAAAQFVNLHRRNKGLPPSTNPNFAQFSSDNSPFLAQTHNRALETIFGIRPSDIDKYSRVVFPVCFVCFQLMYWIVYLHISAFLDTDQSAATGRPVPLTPPVT